MASGIRGTHVFDYAGVQVVPPFLCAGTEDVCDTQCGAIYALDSWPAHQLRGHEAFDEVATSAVIESHLDVDSALTIGALAL